MKPWTWYAGAAAAALLAGGAAALAVTSCKPAGVNAAPPAAVPVEVASVVTSEVVIWDEFSGRVEAVERVNVRSRVAGAVLAVHFREGALVKRDELLVTIDPAPYAAEVDRAEAQAVAAQARVTYTRSEAERARRLLEDRAIAQREHDERSNALREAEANLRGARAVLQSAQLNLDYTRVRAPVAGRVGRLEVTVGNLVAAGPSAPVLTTLVSVSPIYASFEADEAVVARALKDLPGDGASRAGLDRIPVLMLTGATGSAAIEGRLQLVDNQVDARSGTVRVRAIFDNAQGTLVPGQFAKLRMGQARAFPAVLVNERVVGTDQSKRYVMVVGADSVAAYREVTLGSTVEGLRIVTSGLKGDERIVVRGLQRVRPGMRVAPQAPAVDGKRA